MRNTDRIDAVATDEPFTCSTCRASVGPGICIRIVNARPDHPLEVESCDLLVCDDCAGIIGQARIAASHEADERANPELYQERHGIV